MSDIVLSILYMVIMAVMIVGVYIAIKLLKSKTDNKLFNEALDIILDVTDEISQTYVDELKNKNEFDPEHQKMAMEKAIGQIIDNMPTKVYEYIKRMVDSDDITPWIRTKIESYLWRSSGKASENQIIINDSSNDEEIKSSEILYD